MILRGVLVALHLICAVLWIGGIGFLLLVLRPSLAGLAPRKRLDLHQAALRRFLRLVWHLLPVLLASGYALLFLRGGFATAGIAVNLMQALGLVMAALFAYLYFRPWPELGVALETGDIDTAEEALGRIRRLAQLNFVLGLLILGAAAFVPG